MWIIFFEGGKASAIPDTFAIKIRQMVSLKSSTSFIFFFFLLHLSFSQSSTLEINKDKRKPSSESSPDACFNRVMIIPFEPKMYMSQVDKELSENTKKNLPDTQSIAQKQRNIREIFRKGICNNLFIETKMVHNSAYRAVSMFSEDPEIIADLDYIYKSIGYKYTPVHARPDTTKPTAVASLKKATDKAQEIFDTKVSASEQPGTKIKNGQISSTPENREKFMSTAIVNPDALAYLSSKYECDFFVFVNQMDFVVPPNTDYRDLSNDDYSRLIKMHYTILHKNGNEIYADAAKEYSSSRENDANAIVISNFDDLAKEIVSHLGDPNQQKAVQDKRQEEKKKAKQQRSSFDDY